MQDRPLGTAQWPARVFGAARLSSRTKGPAPSLRVYAPAHCFASLLHVPHLLIAVTCAFFNIDQPSTFRGPRPICCQLAVSVLSFPESVRERPSRLPSVTTYFSSRILLNMAAERVRRTQSQWELLQMDCQRNTKLILNLFHYLLCRMQNVRL